DDPDLLLAVFCLKPRRVQMTLQGLPQLQAENRTHGDVDEVRLAKRTVRRGHTERGGVDGDDELRVEVHGGEQREGPANAAVDVRLVAEHRGREEAGDRRGSKWAAER